MQQGVKEIYQDGDFQKYLSCMSKLHSYSTRNTMLVYKQHENPSYVAGFKSWIKGFNRTVKKGEKGIKILAPTTKKSTIEKEKKINKVM